MIVACPTDVVNASPERVWSLLVNPAALAGWSGTALVESPERPLAAGDRLLLRKGPLGIAFGIVALEPPRQLALDVRLPFGVRNEEVVISPLGPGRYRVPGWRGWLLERVLGRRFVEGPEGNLARLKRAAER